MLTIRPRPARIIGFATARQARNGPRALTRWIVVPLVVAHLDDQLLQVDAGRVDEHVDPAVARKDAFDGGVDRGGFRQIDRDPSPPIAAARPRPPRRRRGRPRRRGAPRQAARQWRGRSRRRRPSRWRRASNSCRFPGAHDVAELDRLGQDVVEERVHVVLMRVFERDISVEAGMPSASTSCAGMLIVPFASFVCSSPIFACRRCTWPACGASTSISSWR